MARRARPFYVIDAETDPFDGGKTEIKPFIWGFYDGDIFTHYDTAAELVRYLASQDCVVFAHNGGKFDFAWILPYCSGFQKIRIINGRIAAFKIGKAEFRDSFLLIPCALSAYKKDQIDYKLMRAENRTKPENRRKIIEYLKGDCVYLWDLIDAFRRTYGKQNMTLAGSSMAVWHKMTGRTTERTSAGFYNAFKPYYHGGRVQAFKTGIFTGDFTYIDATSAYPAAMLRPHACGVDAVTDYGAPPADEMATAFLDIEGVSRGALPFDDGEKLQFPDDNTSRLYTVTGHEYLAALDTGTMGPHKIVKHTIFDRKVTFSAYVNHFFKLKAAAADGSKERLLAKLFLNSLYGKFGANPAKYREYIIAPPDEIIRIENGFYPDYEDYQFENFTFGGFALMSRPLPDKARRYYNVATAASITGYQRAQLWRAICRTDTPYYCDTDSIICAGAGSLPISDNIGEWKIEGMGTHLAIAGRKTYALFDAKGRFKPKTAAKGVRLGIADLFRVADGETVTYNANAPTVSIRRGISYQQRDVCLTN